MLSIRLSRVGKTRAPVYRVVVMPKHRDPWAKSVEILGHYNPCKQPHEFVVKADRVQYWISQGAEVSNTLWNLFIDEKIVEGKKRTASHISDTRRTKLDAKAVEAVKASEDAKAKTEADAVKAEEAAKAKKEADAIQAKADAEAAKAAAEAAKVAEAEKAVEVVQATEASDAPATEAPQTEAPAEPTA
jgi:small subunit ribosomal protein S16